MPTIAVLGSLDTKSAEVRYLCDAVARHGFASVVIDLSMREHSEPPGDYSPRQILEQGGVDYGRFLSGSKSECFDCLAEALPVVARALYAARRIDGALCAGGIQNSMLAQRFMAALPFGFPKVLVSALATGQIAFEKIVGRSDICVIPPLTDIVGLNPLTQVIFDNAAAAVTAMAAAGSKGFQRQPHQRILGVTCAGVSVRGAQAAAALLAREGWECCFFHGIVSGGYIMEDLLSEGQLDGALDLCVHDLLVEALGYYRYTTVPGRRLTGLAACGRPAVLSLTGLDVIDMPLEFYESGPLPGREGRQIFYHNATTLHVKATPDEAERGGRLLLERLADCRGPVALVVPTHGFRDNTAPGEALHNPAVDGRLIDLVTNGAPKNVQVTTVDANANDPAFSEAVAREFLRLAQ